MLLRIVWSMAIRFQEQVCVDVYAYNPRVWCTKKYISIHTQSVILCKKPGCVSQFGATVDLIKMSFGVCLFMCF